MFMDIIKAMVVDIENTAHEAMIKTVLFALTLIAVARINFN